MAVRTPAQLLRIVEIVRSRLIDRGWSESRATERGRNAAQALLFKDADLFEALSGVLAGVHWSTIGLMCDEIRNAEKGEK